MLEKKDSARAKTIDRNNKVRLVRALEIIETLGKVPTSSPSPSPKLGEGLERGQFIFIGIKPDLPKLDRRIYKRLTARLPGIVREVKRLHKNGVSWKRMFDMGLEYRYVSMYAQGKLGKQEMIEKLYTAIKQYARRQMTWFKRNKKIKWYPLRTSLSTYTSDIRRAMRKG